MKTIIIKQTNPESGCDTKIFRAYFPGDKKPWNKQPVGVSASTTADPAEIGALRCAVKAFIKTAEPKADSDELETRIRLAKLATGIWCAELEPFN